MITLAQRIEELRTQRGMSRPGLSAALGLPKNAIEKFETGRQTPNQKQQEKLAKDAGEKIGQREQQEKLAAYFGVSIFYLRGESDDRTRQESWLEGAYQEDPVQSPPPRREPRSSAQSVGGEGTVFDSFLRSAPFQELVRTMVLEVLRSPEGQELLSRTVRRELDRQN